MRIEIDADLSNVYVAPCPFCGGMPVVGHHVKDIGGDERQPVYTVKCANKGCAAQPSVAVCGPGTYSKEPPLLASDGRARAVELWNTRNG